MQLIDCQNLFCEVDKYARHAHPEVRGISGRTRIKQSYRPNPIAIESGAVGGVFKTVIETTDRVLGERRLKILRDLADQASEAKSTTQACENAAKIFSKNGADVPFSLLYVVSPDGGSAELVCATNMVKGTPASPAAVRLVDGEQVGWPFNRVLESGKAELVEDLELVAKATGIQDRSLRIEYLPLR